MGSVGEGDAQDFTALGDSVNSAARLAASAATGEILVSDATAVAAGLETRDLDSRTLDLRGRSETLDAWVVTLQPEQ